ncbi:MAG: FadR/GntR family transcriptional regulator [Pseudomonadota bacterium]
MTELVTEPQSAEVDALSQRLRQYLATEGFAHSDRIPAERQLAAEFHVSRAVLRKALTKLEDDGLIWRHVGRGTFVGPRPVHNLNDLAYLKDVARPSQLIEARIAIEPELARLASLHAVSTDFAQMREWAERSRRAPDWRSYEASDTNLHNAIARATKNKLLIHLFDELNTVRRAIVWNQQRTTSKPAKDHFSFDQHDAIVDAIENHDPAEAALRMRDHLRSVRDNMGRLLK